MSTVVIVVDDEEADRYLVRRRLLKAGGFADIREATSGDELLQEYFPDARAMVEPATSVLMLMDVNMHGRDGFETIEEIQRRMDGYQNPPKVAVIVYSSSGHTIDRAKADRIHLVKGYITKPLETAHISLVRQVCELITG